MSRLLLLFASLFSFGPPASAVAYRCSGLKTSVYFDISDGQPSIMGKPCTVLNEGALPAGRTVWYPNTLPPGVSGPTYFCGSAFSMAWLRFGDEALAGPPTFKMGVRLHAIGVRDLSFWSHCTADPKPSTKVPAHE